MVNLISILILLLIKFHALNCQINQKELKKDISATIVIDDQEIDIEAYHYKENEDILNENNTKKHRHLQWFSIGYPMIIESESKFSKNKSFFHFTKDGFYASIQMLTNSQKRVIINEVKKVHNITIEMNQIIELIPRQFACEFELFGDTEEESSIIKGSVKSFKFNPIKIEFTAKNEKDWMKKYISEKIQDIQIVCEISKGDHGFINSHVKLRLQSKVNLKLKKLFRNNFKTLRK
jgi:hypothetical protein